MANKNLKVKKQKEYNPFASRVIRREAVGRIKCFIKKVVPNPKDAFGSSKAAGLWYNNKGRVCTPSYPNAERFDFDTVYFYEVGANDGSYRKCTSKEAAEKAFALLVEFEKRQTQIK
ncbi:MAG: hypothetical protein J6U89_06160 [Bacteroidaceae bacterium]|nr:hypothetical protein [Bacteroidaceae bacterium]